MGRLVKYKIISEEVLNNLIEFLDDVQFEAAASEDKDSVQKVNVCNWLISELLNSYDAIFKKDNNNKKPPQKKSRDQYVDETFMDWNLPEMTDEEYEKLVDQFDNFLRAWEKEYNKKNKNNPKKKPIEKRPHFKKPHIEDVAEYMSLKEIKEFLLDDPELTDYERFELYYEEHDRVQREKQRRKEEKNSTSYEKMLKDLKISPSGGKNNEQSNK
tara:strand:+ start:150 stop:791 length:642 start_codon:yes stop_codon:yes gene_type:complete